MVPKSQCLEAEIDRLVRADGGNPEPTSTSGKKAAKAKDLEMVGWDYPQHLAGRAYGLIVHGDVAGIEGSRRALSDWLDWMGFIDAGAQARLDRCIGYYEPYATSHDALDRDELVQEEARNVAHAVAKTYVPVGPRRCSRNCRVRGQSRSQATCQWFVWRAFRLGCGLREVGLALMAPFSIGRRRPAPVMHAGPKRPGARRGNECAETSVGRPTTPRSLDTERPWLAIGATS